MDNEKIKVLEAFDPAEEVEEAIALLKKQQEILTSAMMAVVGVIAIGFVAIIIAAFDIFTDHQDYAAARYNEYIKLIEER